MEHDEDKKQFFPIKIFSWYVIRQKLYIIHWMRGTKTVVNGKSFCSLSF